MQATARTSTDAPETQAGPPACSLAPIMEIARPPVPRAARAGSTPPPIPALLLP